MRKARAPLAAVATLLASCGGNVAAPTAVDPISGPRWSAPEKIDPTSTHDRNPALAVSARGEMVAVWLHEVIGGRGFVFGDGLRASRFTPEAGWGSSSPIPGTKDMRGAVVAMDDVGTAVALVGASVDGRSRVWACRATRASGWSAPEPVQEGGGPFSDARIVQLLPGVALAAWSEFDGTRLTLWSRPRDDRGWRRTQPIDLTGDSINSFELVSTGRGQALATWYEATRPGGGAIFANLFDAASGWSRAQQIGTAGTFPVAGFDAASRALVLWNTEGGVMMSRFLPGSGWTGEARGPGGERSTYNVSLAVGPSGRALAAWHEAAFELWAAVYEPLAGWGPARLLSDTDPSEAQVVIDAEGRGVVVWDEDAYVLAHAYLPATGWGRQERVGPGSRAVARIDAQGNVTVVWPGDGIRFARLALGE